MNISDQINSIIINILNYEFPDVGNDSHDANWLIAELTVKTAQIDAPYTANAYIRAEELTELGALCDELLRGEKDKAQFIFLDGAIEMLFARNNDMWEITVSLYGELKPPDYENDSFDCKMNLDKEQLNTFAEGIKEDCNKFPPRSNIHITRSGLKKFHID